MDLKDLNKSQLILLAVLLSFVTSIATGITTVTLMQQAPSSVTVPITRVVRQTVEKIVPVETNNTPALSEDQKKLLEDLKAIKPLTVTLVLKKDKEEKILGTGLFLGDNKIVIASLIPKSKEGEVYVVRSVLGEQKISKLTQEKNFTIIEVKESEILSPPIDLPTSPTGENNAGFSFPETSSTAQAPLFILASAWSTTTYRPGTSSVNSTILAPPGSTSAVWVFFSNAPPILAFGYTTSKISPIT